MNKKWLVMGAFMGLALSTGCATVQKDVTYAASNPVGALNVVDNALTTTAQQINTLAQSLTGTVNTLAVAVNSTEANTLSSVNSIEASAASVKATVQSAPTLVEQQLSVAVLNPATAKHVLVAKGNTLWSISAANYGTGFLWPLVCTQNGLANCNLITTGQTISVAPASVFNAYPASVLQGYKQTAYATK